MVVVLRICVVLIFLVAVFVGLRICVVLIFLVAMFVCVWVRSRLGWKKFFAEGVDITVFVGNLHGSF